MGVRHCEGPVPARISGCIVIFQICYHIYQEDDDVTVRVGVRVGGQVRVRVGVRVITPGMKLMSYR